MKHLWGGLLIIFLLILVAIQFIPVNMTNPPVQAEVPASPPIRAILHRACYDCHSNATDWRWYTRIAPISWLATNYVNEGRKELNFSTWNLYTPAQQAANMQKIWEEIEEGEMPPLAYRTVHASARLNPDDKSILQSWTVESSQ